MVVWGSEFAIGGQILASSLLMELAESAEDIRFGDGHDALLKGLTGTTRVLPVIWDQSGSLNGRTGPATHLRGLNRLVLRAGSSFPAKAVIGLAAAAGVVAAGFWVPGTVSDPDASLLPAHVEYRVFHRLRACERYLWSG